MSVSILNTTADLSGRTLLTEEGAYTVEGLHTFDRDPNPPFAVSAGSAVVPNLDADKVDGLEANAFMRHDGSVTLTAGIPFPATQVASTNANTLDDYEEGTFTPTIASSGGGAATYGTQVGRYVKVGRLVHVFGRVAIATKGTLSAGDVTITGLPFAADNTANQLPAGPIHFDNMTTSLSNQIGYIAAGGSSINVQHIVAAGATGYVNTTVADISATYAAIFSVVYFAAA